MFRRSLSPAGIGPMHLGWPWGPGAGAGQEGGLTLCPVTFSLEQRLHLLESAPSPHGAWCLHSACWGSPVRGGLGAAPQQGLGIVSSMGLAPRLDSSRGHPLGTVPNTCQVSDWAHRGGKSKVNLFKQKRCGGYRCSQVGVWLQGRLWRDVRGSQN